MEQTVTDCILPASTGSAVITFFVKKVPPSEKSI